jgi:hypothetical protein
MIKFEGPEMVKIKRIPKVGYFNISAYPRSVTVLGCEIGKTGYKTGLTESEQELYEKALELKPGALGKHGSFWETFNVEHSIRLYNNKTTEISTDNIINQLRYKVLLASSKVANSEINKNDPNAIFYIDDQEAKAKMQQTVFNFELEGMKKIMSLSPEEKRGTLRLFGKTGLDTMSETMLDSQLYLELKKDPKNFLETLADSNLATKMFIQELVEKHILTRKGNYYIHGEDTIANSTEECVLYFNDIKNQSVKLTLETRLKKAKK